MKHMPLFILFVLSLFFIAADATAQIANPGFESWTNNQPDGWYTYSLIFNDVSKSSVAHSGSSSLKASIVMVNNVPVGSFVQGGTGAQGFPVTQRNSALNGYYQFTSVGDDHFSAAVIMYAGAMAIGAGQFDGASSTGSLWKSFSVPITYVPTGVPQTISIQFVISPGSSSSTTHVGSFYLIDDLSLALASGVNDGPSTVPPSYALGQNFPNPFNPSTTVRYSIPKESHVVLSVYNILGQEVRVLVNDVKPAGTYQAFWNGEDNSGIKVGSGLYFYRMQAGAFSEMKRMVLVK